MSFEEMAENAKSPGLPTEFKFDESLVRVVVKDGEPWFVAKDVCEILDIGDPDSDSRFDDDEKGVRNTRRPLAVRRKCSRSTSSGLYSLHLHEPEARGQTLPKVGHERRPAGDPQDRQATRDPAATSASRTMRSTTSVGLERALLDAQIIAIEMQRIGVHFLQQMTDDPEMGAARAEPEPGRVPRRGS